MHMALIAALTVWNVTVGEKEYDFL